MLTYQVLKVSNEEEASKISSFFLSDVSFDDTRHTPGEIEHFQTQPLLSINSNDLYFQYIADEHGEIVGVISFRENDHKTGGFTFDYIVVHKAYRKHGIASKLIDSMLETVQAINGRYVLTYTCDTSDYEAIRNLFARKGFVQVGHLPHFYFEGEGQLLYYKAI